MPLGRFWVALPFPPIPPAPDTKAVPAFFSSRKTFFWHLQVDSDSCSPFPLPFPCLKYAGNPSPAERWTAVRPEKHRLDINLFCNSSNHLLIFILIANWKPSRKRQSLYTSSSCSCRSSDREMSSLPEMTVDYQKQPWGIEWYLTLYCRYLKLDYGFVCL